MRMRPCSASARMAMLRRPRLALRSMPLTSKPRRRLAGSGRRTGVARGHSVVERSGPCSVTGATAGLGKEIALRLAQDHLQVIVVGRDAARGAAVVAQIEAAGARC